MTKTSRRSESTVVLCKTEAMTAFSKKPCYLTQSSNFWGIDIDVQICSFQLQGLLKLFIIAKNCIHFPAQSSYASMPLVQAETQHLQLSTTSPSTRPRLLSPAPLHCSTSSWSPLHSVTHCWFWNLYELCSGEGNCWEGSKGCNNLVVTL